MSVDAQKPRNHRDSEVFRTAFILAVIDGLSKSAYHIKSTRTKKPANHAVNGFLGAGS